MFLVGIDNFFILFKLLFSFSDMNIAVIDSGTNMVSFHHGIKGKLLLFPEFVEDSGNQFPKTFRVLIILLLWYIKHTILPYINFIG